MKHSKLFLTGMAALLLSFGLMMTGCDSDGGSSDKKTPPNPDAYIGIVETTAGADAAGANPAVAAVYTVTVKQSLAGKVVTFTNVADDDVVYGPPIDADDTPAKQATAIVTKINAAANPLYTAAQADTSVAVFTLTANTAGAITNAPAVAIEDYEAPQDKTATIAAALTAGDNAVKITGVTATNAFKDDDTVKAYIKNDGTELFITTATPAPDGYVAAAGAVFIADRGANNVPVLWVKGLPAAGTTVTSGDKLLSGTAGAVSVRVAGTALVGDVGDLTPVSGTAILLTGEKTIVAYSGSPTSAQVSLINTGDGKIKFNDGNVQDLVPSTVFDTQITAVLTATTSGLAAGDKVTFDAKGIITSAQLLTTTTDEDKINAVLALLDTTLDATPGSALGTVTIPAGKTLTIGATGGVLTIAATTNVVIGGTLVVGGSANKVTITKGTITGTSANTALATGSTGIMVFADEALALADGGSIVVAGTGKITLPNTSIEAGTYTAIGEVTITAVSTGDTIETGTTANDGLVMTGGVSLLGHTPGAKYTLKKNNDGSGLVTFGGAADAATKVVVPPKTGGTGASIEGDAKASIVLGSGIIELGGGATTAAGTIDLAQYAKIGVFTQATTGGNNTEVTAVGTCVIDTSKKTGALANGTITVGASSLKLGGASGTAASIKADLATVTTGGA